MSVLHVDEIKMKQLCIDWIEFFCILFINLLYTQYNEGFTNRLKLVYFTLITYFI